MIGTCLRAWSRGDGDVDEKAASELVGELVIRLLALLSAKSRKR